MKYRREGMHVYVRLDGGDEIVGSLSELAHHEVIEGGFVVGIGSAKDVELGFYDLAERRYVRQHFAEPREIASASGPVSMLDGRAHIHLHAVMSDRDFQSRAGHLFAATVTATAEFVITVCSSRLEREADEKTGLALLKL
jgi:uncharacterized protein